MHYSPSFCGHLLPLPLLLRTPLWNVQKLLLHEILLQLPLHVEFNPSLSGKKRTSVHCAESGCNGITPPLDLEISLSRNFAPMGPPGCPVALGPRGAKPLLRQTSRYSDPRGRLHGPHHQQLQGEVRQPQDLLQVQRERINTSFAGTVWRLKDGNHHHMESPGDQP